VMKKRSCCRIFPPNWNLVLMWYIQILHQQPLSYGR
jgi:hypothetical protein